MSILNPRTSLWHRSRVVVMLPDNCWRLREVSRAHKGGTCHPCSALLPLAQMKQPPFNANKMVSVNIFLKMELALKLETRVEKAGGNVHVALLLI